MKKSCILYDSWGELFIKLPDEKAGKLIKTIATYCFKGEVQTDDPVVDAMFGMIKMKLDEDAQAYEEVKIQRSEAGRKGMAKRWNNTTITEDNTVITNDNTTITEDNEDITKITVSVSDSVSVSDKDIKKEKEQKKKFIKPSVEEVREYCNERGNGVNPEAFIDFYESKGWKVGNQPMKDWRAAVRTWEKRDGGRSSPKKPVYQNTKGRYDFAALQAEVIGNG